MKLPLRGESFPLDWPDDVALLQSGLRGRGYNHTDSEVAQLWADYSDQMWCATWLSVDSSDDAENLIRFYSKVE